MTKALGYQKEAFNLNEILEYFSTSNEDLTPLLDLLKQGKIKPIVAAKIHLNEAARARITGWWLS